METLFLIAVFTIFYTYIGYGLLLFVLVWIQRLARPRKQQHTTVFTPSLTLIVTAYNEVACIEEKIRNSIALDYPPELLRFIFVTDGSDDGTDLVVAHYPQIQLVHEPLRSGKIAAIHRAMQQVQTETVVFTDANTLLNHDALLHIVQHYKDKKTGAVAGEKRIDIRHINDATAGEGLYWRYESLLKKAESELYSVAGAAGELFSIRTALYEPIPDDTILDDLVISMKISTRGYRIRYEPSAFATEKASLSVMEEKKRKIRIAAGGIQTIMRMPLLLLPFPNCILWFEYISHRVFRWIIAPYMLVLAFVLNAWLVYNQPGDGFLSWLFALQILFYAVAFIGSVIRTKQVRFRVFFVPYYFCLMNFSMIKGMLRYVFAGQTVTWERAARR